MIFIFNNKIFQSTILDSVKEGKSFSHIFICLPITIRQMKGLKGVCFGGQSTIIFIVY